MKFGFVILHYLTEDDTERCINSILSMYDSFSYDIVVVDNLSNNGSLEKLMSTFKSFKFIHFLKNEKNLGFARGNNRGYEYCRSELKCDTIIVLNNDVLVNSKNLFVQIKKDINEFNCAVIGPDIMSLLNGNHQNPMIEKSLKKKQIIKEIMRYSLLYLCAALKIYGIIQCLVGRKKVKKIQVNRNTITNKVINQQLHGSFLIFTPKFTTKMETAFCNDTFLYLEETILYKICEVKHLTMLYDPQIKVLHKEDSATNKLNQNTNEKRIFIFKNMLRSYRVLLKFY